MKVFSASLILAILGMCHGYSFLIPASLKHPGICFYNGHLLPKGDNQMPTTCQNLRCNNDGSILVQGCGRLEIPQCSLLGPSNLDKAYPDCCEMTYRCSDDEGNMYTRQWNQLKMLANADSNAKKDQLNQRDMNARADWNMEEQDRDSDEMADMDRLKNMNKMKDNNEDNDGNQRNLLNQNTRNDDLNQKLNLGQMNRRNDLNEMDNKQQMNKENLELDNRRML